MKRNIFRSGERATVSASEGEGSVRPTGKNRRTCYHYPVPLRTEPRTPGQWVRYIVVAVIALFLVWWMLRVYVF
ncbi:MAG TPA: hypothetical protein VHW09_26680 [Bryobacteraceae bacterium]|jgi:hypothetical protein|nr:hypothetical protein [Bryobacteraceae bacterium]